MSYFKNSQQNNKNNKNSSKRPMQITKKSAGIDSKTEEASGLFGYKKKRR